MVAAGHGDERASFTDMNIRGPFSVTTTAAIYLSFFEPTGSANMLDNISRLREPLLSVAGTPDRTQRGAADGFSRAPANPLNCYVTVDADHLGTPSAAREALRGQKPVRNDLFAARQRLGCLRLRNAPQRFFTDDLEAAGCTRKDYYFALGPDGVEPARSPKRTTSKS